MSMSQPGHQDDIDWARIRRDAERFPEPAFRFVQEGLTHTVRAVHDAEDEPTELLAGDESRHVTGRDLCLGLRDLAIERYGLLARTVLRKWGINRTDDFGVIVFALIDKGILRASDSDNLADFRSVYDFDEAFGDVSLN